MYKNPLYPRGFAMSDHGSTHLALIKLLSITALLCLLCLTASAALATASEDRFGQNLIYPDLPQKTATPDYFLADKPTVTVDAANRTAAISFNTTAPAPKSKIHYGLDSVGTDVRKPIYLKTVAETLTGTSTTHVVKIDLGSFMKEFRPQNVTQDGAIIEYRIELYNPQASSTSYYGGRFRIDSNYSRIPCIALGPFVDVITKDSVYISWETDLMSRGHVSVNGQQISDNSTGTRHLVRIAGLQPAKEYVYDVYVEGVRDERSYKFRTSPANDSFTFAFMADSQAGIGGGGATYNGVNYDEFSRLLDMAYGDDADFILMGGDLTSGYTTSEADYRLQLDTYKQAIGTIGGIVPIYEVPGNHQALMDAFDDGSQFGVEIDKRDDGVNSSAEAIFAEEFICPDSSYPAPENSEAPEYKGTAYYFDYGNVRFIVYNSNYWFSTGPEKYGGNYQGFVMNREIEWISTVLKDADADPSIDHVFMMTHTPAFQSIVRPPLYSRGLDRRDELWKTISNADKVVALLAGHEHYYNRALFDTTTPVYANNSTCAGFGRPVWQIVSGGAGGHNDGYATAPWANATKAFYSGNHYCLLTVENGRVTMTVKSDTGEVIDSCVLKDGPTIPPAGRKPNGEVSILVVSAVSAVLIFAVLIYGMIRLSKR